MAVRSPRLPGTSTLYNQRGLSLVELSLSMVVMCIMVTGTILAFQWGLKASASARRQANANNILQTMQSRIQSMDFFNVFAVDSASANFGLWAAYPEMTALNTMLTSIRNVGFTRFTIEVVFMRRDLSDANSNGLTTDLIPFADANGDRIDDWDATVRYLDQNADGDFYDTYTSAGRPIAEEPDTHLKQLSIKIYQKNLLVGSKEGVLLSQEQLTGAESAASEAAYSLLLNTPENNGVLFRAATAAQIASRGLAIAKTYGEEAPLQADTGTPLVVSGVTEPAGTVTVYRGNTVTGLNSAISDTGGLFSFSANVLTSQLAEGSNKLYARTTKGTGYSPFVSKDVVLDINPPAFSQQTPTGTVRNLSPFVGVVFQDVGVATATVSGVEESVITLYSAGAPVSHQYDAITRRIAWLDSATGLPPTLADGVTYVVKAEGGDKARYKSSTTWTFRVDIDDTDPTPPVVTNRQPTGVNAPTLPTISCQLGDPESGVIPQSVQLSVDGVVVVSTGSASPLGLNYNALTGVVTYTPAAAYTPASFHRVQVRATHWSANPSDAASRTLDPASNPMAEWTFTCAP